MNNRSSKVGLSVLLLLAFVAAACSSDGDKGSSGAGSHATQAREHESADPIAALVPIKKSQGLLAQRGYSIGPVATDARFLYWEAAAGDEDQDVALLKRDLRSGAVATLARGMFRAFGLAATHGGIVYATRSGAGAELDVIDPTGKHRRVLSRSLGAPFDARGDIVAWAEADPVRLRVVVRNMRTGRQFVAMNRRRCRGTQCYRVDRVTVADSGVVIALGTVGQGYPSLIVRRRWHDAKPEVAQVAGDPQPDLVPSASGALYYHLGHGWVEWKFGEARPRRTSLRGARPWLLAAGRSRQLILGGPACGTKVGVRFQDGRTRMLPSPASSPASPTKFGPLCRELMGYAWTGKRLLLAWSIVPKISVDAHKDVGISGLITAARVP